MRQVTETFFVSPQITVEDLPAVKAAGITTLINNRPDHEIGPDEQGAAIEEAATALGLLVVHNPIVHPTEEGVRAQYDAVAAAEGPVLAYCRSGTRSITVWALAQAGEMQADAILTAATEAGYDLSGLRGYLESAMR